MASASSDGDTPSASARDASTFVGNEPTAAESAGWAS